MAKTLIIIPTHQEKAAISSLACRVFGVSPSIDILFVDDASSDGTRVEIERLKHLFPQRVFALLRDRRSGLGTAYLDGFQWALKRQYRYIVQMDGDGSHDPVHLPDLLTRLQTYPLVIGSRYMSENAGDCRSFKRKIVSTTACFFARELLGLQIKDFTGGFNGWQSETLEALDLASIRAQGFAIQIELKLRACRQGLEYWEIPILFHTRKQGFSKLRARDFWEALLLLKHYRSSRDTSPS